MTLRDFPPVDPVAPPARFSQTLLARANACPRSAYLLLKHGSKASHQMDRGSAFHAMVERCVRMMIEREEMEIPADVAKSVLDAVIEEHPEWTIPVHERKNLREQTWHWAQFGQPIDPARVLGVEQLFVLEVAGRTVSGKIDLLCRDEATLEVVDYKTAPAVPTQAEFEASFQTPLYAALVLLGKPVTREPCGTCYGTPGGAGTAYQCSDCGGKGYVEHVAPLGVGDGATHVRVAERYPSLDPRKSSTGMVVERATTLSRADVHEVLTDIEAKVREFDRALQSWKFEARDGSHCATCPARQECPIPETLRDESGAVDSVEDAERLATRWRFLSEEAARTKKAVREFAKAEGLGEVRLGADEVLRFRHQESQSVSDWEGLSAAIREAAEYGRELDRSRFVKVRKATNFDRVKLTPEER